MEGLQPPSPFSVHLSLLPPRLLCVSVTQSRPTLCDPMDCSPPGSSVRGILQARVLEWVAISLLQGILPTQRLNPGLLHCGQIPYQLSARAALPVSYSCSLPPSRTVPTSFPLSLSLSHMCRHTCLLPLWLVRPTAMIKLHFSLPQES